MSSINKEAILRQLISSLKQPGWLNQTMKSLNYRLPIEELEQKVEDIESEVTYTLAFPSGTLAQITDDVKKLRERQETLRDIIRYKKYMEDAKK